jgi:ketosteroid isomerase-like protein
MPYSRVLRRCLLAAAFLAAGLTAAATVSAHDAEQQIRDLDAKWVAAFKARDFSTIEAIYAPDGLFLPPDAPPTEGAKAAAEIWKSWGELPNVEVTFGPLRVEVASSGDMAYDYGAYTFAFDGDKGRVIDKGKYVVVWKKLNGVWKVAADMFNSNGSQ